MKISKQVMTKITSQKQMSEAFINASLLALSGGFQDAYTYNVRDQVFANAQTGNIVLMSQHMMAGAWKDAARYLFPLFAFALGVFLAERVQNAFKYAKGLHWRQGILVAEILILFAVGFIPEQFNLMANFLVSLSCALQVQSFRKVGGYGYASTMCIGNLRSGTVALSVYLREKKPAQRKQALYYFGIIFVFALGAGIGGNLSLHFGIPTIWVSCIFLFISFILMFAESIEQEQA